MDNFFQLKSIIYLAVFSCTLLSCVVKNSDGPFKIFDENLKIELVAENPIIRTPIGLAIDTDDVLYVLESNTHSPPKEYKGPAFDRILSCSTNDDMTKSESWKVFADSLKFGMNLAIGEKGEVFLTSKKNVLVLKDIDLDGRSDAMDTLVSMVEPNYVYDHAGIMGITFGRSGWVYLSRGNIGANPWTITGSDGTQISGYGEGGIIFRCKKDGSQIEKLASGFWNPFDLKFLKNGRLLVTDNDPDSRGPNRLIEVVPGGDYGYKSLYGGSGVHPFQAWNAELPGTLPFAAPLGEAPCAFIDIDRTNFNKANEKGVLVNIWEESNIVYIPLSKAGSTVAGEPKILLQGDSIFRPVAFAPDSKGNVYVSDWVVRKYPVHGRGRIWKLSFGDNKNAVPVNEQVNRFDFRDASWDELVQQLTIGDEFEKSIVRYQMNKPENVQNLIALATDGTPKLKVQALLVLLDSDVMLEKSMMVKLLFDEYTEVQKMALLYIAKKARVDMQQGLQNVLAAGKIGPDIFDIYLSTVQHLQPAFIEKYKDRSPEIKDELTLPEGFIKSIIEDEKISEVTKALALPYLENPHEHKGLLTRLLNSSKLPGFGIGLVRTLRNLIDKDLAKLLLRMALDDGINEELRSQALLSLESYHMIYGKQVKPLVNQNNEVLQYAAIRYLCKCTDENIIKDVETYLANHPNETSISLWKNCNGNNGSTPIAQEWAQAINDQGNPKIGRLIFESSNTICMTCHKVSGWGGVIGPDLSKVGSSKNTRQLANAILNPSLEIAPEWQGWFVVDENGGTHQGRQIDVHGNRVELMNENGEFNNYPNPQSYGVMTKSIMPEGLQNPLTTNEFNDLIGYLTSLNGL